MPSSRAHPRATPICTGLLSLAVLVTGPLAAQDFTGTYRVRYMGTPLTLVLEAGPDGSVRGRLFGSGVDLAALGRQVRRDDGEPAVRGTLTAPGGPGGRFEFARARGGEFGFLLVPSDAKPASKRDGAQLAYATRLSESVLRSMLPPGNGPAEAESGRPERSRRFVGMWRSSLEGDGASPPRLAFMEFRSDGVMVDLGTRPVEGTPSKPPAGHGEEAGWRIRAGVLEVSSGTGLWVPLARYEFDGDDRLILIVPRNGTRQVWSRVR